MPIDLLDYNIETVDELRKKANIDKIEQAFHDAESYTYDHKHREVKGVSEYIKSIKKEIDTVEKLKYSDCREDEDAEIIYEAYTEASDACNEAKNQVDSIKSDIEGVEESADRMCVEFQNMLSAAEIILNEYEALLLVTQEIYGKIEPLENSKWRIFEKYLRGT
jgi:DNA repair ATPase RecN